MQQVSDALLLTMAQIAATLIGLLLVGVFFYLQSGYRHLESWGPEGRPFFRASVKLVLLVYALVVAVSLGLVTLDEAWTPVLFGLMSLLALGGMTQVTVYARRLPRVVRKRHAQTWVVWPALLFILGLPWALAGWSLTREALTWTLFLSGALALFFTVNLLLMAVETADEERFNGSRTEREREGG